MNITRVLIVDDHAVVRRGLGIFVRALDDALLVGEAADGATAVRLCGELLPNIVLMDIMMPIMDGIEATQQIIRQYPNVRVIALTSMRDDQHVDAMLQAGAHGFVHKNVSFDELASLIRGVP
jgi:DNA-binding NarL/FixJ family response regulator